MRKTEHIQTVRQTKPRRNIYIIGWAKKRGQIHGIAEPIQKSHTSGRHKPLLKFNQR